MESFKLNPKQIFKLITNKYLEVFEEKNIELHNNELVLNCNGDIYRLESVKMQFLKPVVKKTYLINYIQNLICEHLNLKQNEVIYVSSYDEEFEFYIRFTAYNKHHILICESRKALSNMHAISDDFTNTNTQYIGIYKRLGESAYYFRWIDDN